jgi:hypothetical protein
MSNFAIRRSGHSLLGVNRFSPNNSWFVNYSIEQITFISVPRPTVDRMAYLYSKLAIGSWLSVSPCSNVLLFINRSGFGPLADEIDDLYGPGRVIYRGSIKHDFADIPYIDEWFQKGIQYSPTNFVCFINSDILVSGNWLTRAKQVFRIMAHRPILVIDQRMDFTLNLTHFDNLKFGGNSLLQQIDVMVKNSPHSIYQPTGIDMYLFRIDCLRLEPKRIPPFMMGRPLWDNWLVGYATTIGDTITFALNPPVYHIRHQSQWAGWKCERVSLNYHTWKANNEYMGSNVDAKWRVSGNALVRQGKSIQIPLNFH